MSSKNNGPSKNNGSSKNSKSSTVFTDPTVSTVFLLKSTLFDIIKRKNKFEKNKRFEYIKDSNN